MAAFQNFECMRIAIASGHACQTSFTDFVACDTTNDVPLFQTLQSAIIRIKPNSVQQPLGPPREQMDHDKPDLQNLSGRSAVLKSDCNTAIVVTTSQTAFTASPKLDEVS